jgi:hypothetical protein
MIASLFPGRERRHIKNKYNREERSHPELVTLALKNAMPMQEALPEVPASVIEAAKLAKSAPKKKITAAKKKKKPALKKSSSTKKKSGKKVTIAKSDASKKNGSSIILRRRSVRGHEI